MRFTFCVLYWCVLVLVLGGSLHATATDDCFKEDGNDVLYTGESKFCNKTLVVSEKSYKMKIALDADKSLDANVNLILDDGSPLSCSISKPPNRSPLIYVPDNRDPLSLPIEATVNNTHLTIGTKTYFITSNFTSIENDHFTTKFAVDFPDNNPVPEFTIKIFNAKFYVAPATTATTTKHGKESTTKAGAAESTSMGDIAKIIAIVVMSLFLVGCLIAGFIIWRRRTKASKTAKPKDDKDKKDEKKDGEKGKKDEKDGKKDEKKGDEKDEKKDKEDKSKVKSGEEGSAIKINIGEEDKPKGPTIADVDMTPFKDFHDRSVNFDGFKDPPAKVDSSQDAPANVGGSQDPPANDIAFPRIKIKK